MKWADDLIERILMLDICQTCKNLAKILIGENVVEILRCDLQLEYHQTEWITSKCDCFMWSRKAILSLANYWSNSKTGSEEHIDWLETQMELMTSMGIENYTQSLLDS